MGDRRRVPVSHGESSVCGWKLQIWTIDFDEHLAENALYAKDRWLQDCLKQISVDTPPEFVLHREGFCIIHSARRGISISIGHSGAWLDTDEVFLSQFFVSREELPHKAEPFRASDPIASEYEVQLLAEQLASIGEPLGRRGLNAW